MAYNLNINESKKIVKLAMDYEKEAKIVAGKISCDDDSPIDTFSYMSQFNDAQTLSIIREVIFAKKGLHAFPVQLLAAVELIKGNIVEMKTGEGKTLVAVLAAILYRFKHQETKVQIITVNDYLAQRDFEENQDIFQVFGLTSSVLIDNPKMQLHEKQMAYASDILYTTSSTVGFDYLRSNGVQKWTNTAYNLNAYAIVDEADSILLDDARKPLIIGANGVEPSALVKISAMFARTLSSSDVIVDREHQTVSLSESGVKKANDVFNVNNIHDYQHKETLFFINRALYAKYLQIRDVDYLVKDGQIKLIDKNTNRVAEGTRYSDGLHQAIEAKEGVLVLPDNVTLASITYPSLFNLYKKFAGMTGTAYTARNEFKEFYGKKVVRIPTNRPVVRQELEDRLFLTKEGKLKAVVERVKFLHSKGQPVLIGTLDIRTAEILNAMFEKADIEHVVLTAKNDPLEATIVAKAGQFNAVTIATNMAGRGTDIKLGEGVVDLGGLAVIVTERADDRRIDDQFAGRTGRQGEPGQIQFFISYQDKLLSEYLGITARQAFIERLSTTRVSTKNDEIDDESLKRLITVAQKRVQGQQFDERKDTTRFDEVMAKQRLAFYTSRERLLRGNADTLLSALSDKDWSPMPEIVALLNADESGQNSFYEKIKPVVVTSLDQLWIDQLLQFEIARQQVTNEGYRQIDPVIAYSIRLNALYDSFVETWKNNMRELLDKKARQVA